VAGKRSFLRLRKLVFTFSGMIAELMLVAALIGAGFFIAWAAYALFV
jgi:hypothetical protein